MYYLDNNSTTRPEPEVVAAMMQCMSSVWGNASSTHGLGQEAKRLVAAARAQVARFMGCKPAEIVFTSGATEANHMAVRGALSIQKRDRLAVSTVEHAGLLKLVRELERQGMTVDWMQVNRHGVLDLESARRCIGPRTAVVSAMAANNETGVLMPVAALAVLAHENGALLHVDATQWIGKLPFDFASSGIDLLTVSAHKFGGPKGVGAIIVRQGIICPALFPGSQERGRRGGTENVPGIVGFATAARMLVEGEDLGARARRIGRLRDRLEAALLARLPGVEIFGAEVPRLPNTSYVRFGALNADLVLQRLEQAGVYASSGSACVSGGTEPSHVLMAMGVAPDAAACAVRMSLGTAMTEADIDAVAAQVTGVLAPLLAIWTPEACTAQTVQ